MSLKIGTLKAQPNIILRIR